MTQYAFSADAGTYQGRIESATAAQGSYVYEFGHTIPGRLYTFYPGDKHRITQTADMTGVQAIRATVRTRGADTMPENAHWVFRMLLGESVVASRVLDRRDLQLVDLVMNLHGIGDGAGLTGNHIINFELAIAGGTGPYEAELPGCALDAVVVDMAGVAVEVINRNPEPGELGVPVGGPFLLEVGSTSGVDLPVTSLTTIYFDGAVIFTASAFAAGWSGSSLALTGSSGLRFSLVPTLPLLPSATHTIRVVSAVSLEPGGALDTTWTFSTVDTIAPAVTEALAIREREVRVTFGETVVQGNGTGETDALNPANYTLAVVNGGLTDANAFVIDPPRPLPAVTPAVVSVETDGSGRVILHLDITMTRRAIYQVTVANVADLNGNQMTTPSNVAEFEGFSVPAPATRSFDLYQVFLPENVRQLDRSEGGGELRLLFDILQEPIDLLLGILDRMQDIYDPDLAPEAFVDLMLLELGNPFTFALSEIEKRKLVQILVPIYQSKGTGPGIVDALRLFMGIEVTLNVYAWSPLGLGEAVMGESWILGSSDPIDLLTFQVRVPRVLTAEERLKMTQIIDYMMAAEELFVILEPEEIVTPDHWQLGYSILGTQTLLH